MLCSTAVVVWFSMPRVDGSPLVTTAENLRVVVSAFDGDEDGQTFFTLLEVAPSLSVVGHQSHISSCRRCLLACSYSHRILHLSVWTILHSLGLCSWQLDRTGQSATLATTPSWPHSPTVCCSLCLRRTVVLHSHHECLSTNSAGSLLLICWGAAADVACRAG